MLAATGASLLDAVQLPAFNTPQADYLSFDLHAHPGRFFWKGSKEYPGDDAGMKTVTEMNSGRLSGAFFGLVGDGPLIEITPTGIRTNREYASGEAWKEYQRQMAALKELLKTLPATVATRVGELDKALKNKKVAAFIACEGGDFLDGGVEYLDQMYEEPETRSESPAMASSALSNEAISAKASEKLWEISCMGIVV